MAYHFRAQWHRFVLRFKVPDAMLEQAAKEAAEYRATLAAYGLSDSDVPPCARCPDIVIYACKNSGKECREFIAFCEDPPRYELTYGGKKNDIRDDLG